MLTLDKETIIKTIENDNSFNKGGRYRSDFIDDTMIMCCEYIYMTKLQLLIAFSGKEMVISRESFDIIVTIVADDGQQLLLKETVVYSGGGITTEFWLVNKHNLTADTVWEYMG